ncbi:MAG: adenosylcobinamide-GDP ribazoletransferase [Tannerellaceae bacterium]|nr:adenosylcobinamide-GDP ribazoletransferase [Tannerellaceae bacterium]
MKQIIAAIIFFTRIPLWRFIEVPADYYKRVVPLWSFTGWITSGIQVLVLFLASLALPYPVALLMAIISRLLLTGGLHEDGLADFSDGFGGGTSKEKILTIMKDSHIGTYGVITLLFYFALWYAILLQLPLEITACALLAADPVCKSIAAMTINRLPYARKENDAKIKTSYTPMLAIEYIYCLLSGVMALLWLPETRYLAALIFPCCSWLVFTSYIKKKIGGYTGDCCGAIFLLCELSFMLAFLIIYQL